MKFSYKAVKDGKIIRGQIEAVDAKKVVEYLKTRGYIIVHVAAKGMAFSGFPQMFIGHAGFGDMVDFTRQIAIMLNAGLPIVDSLDILKKQTTKPALLKIISSIDDEVRAGNSLSYALKKHRNVFNNLYISLVKAGEASGKLDQIMLKLADNLEKSREFKSKIKGALIYPVIVVSGMLVVMFIMMTFVIPQLFELFKSFDVELPFTTQMLIIVSNFLQSYWILIVLGTAGIIFVLKQYLKTRVGKKMFDIFVLKLPIVSKIIKISALVDTTRTFAILLGSGVSILEALEIVIETSNNLVYQDAFRDVYKKIEKGESLGKAFEEEHIFPPILIQMATVGEQTGHLDDTLMRISRYFEAEAEVAIKTMTTLIEPMILVVLGLGVGFLVFAVIMPIYSLTSSIK